MIVSFVRRFTSLFGVRGVGLSASGTLLAGLCLWLYRYRYGVAALPCLVPRPYGWQTPLSSLFFPFLPSLLFSEVGELPLFPLRWLGLGGAGVLVAECGSGVVERGGGGRAFMKALFGFGSSLLADACRWCSFHVFKLSACYVWERRGSMSRSAFGSRLGSRRLLALVFVGYGSVGLLMLNATGQYVTFRSESGTLVVATWWQQVGHRLLVQKATPLWSFSGCQVSGGGLCLSWPTALLGVSGSSLSPGAWNLRACPVQRLSPFSWDPHPRESVEGVLRATSVLELAAMLADSRVEGKMVVGSGVDHVVVSGVGPQLGRAAVVRVWCVLYDVSLASLYQGGCQRLASWRCGRCVLLTAASGGGFPCLAFVGLSSWPCWSVLVAVFRVACSLGVPWVQGSSACGPSTLWRSEVAVFGVRRSFARGCSVSFVVTPVCAFLTLWRPERLVLVSVFAALVSAAAPGLAGGFSLPTMDGNFGSVLQVHDASKAMTQTHEALVCVELDIKKPRLERIWIGCDKDGFWQKLATTVLPLGNMRQEVSSLGSAYVHGTGNEQLEASLPRSGYVHGSGIERLKASSPGSVYVH
ncbi:hypothetical protein Taro_031830, partial [Colocasia esculenta]|nr:hypothetical protein [Colocasia esculenta]